LTVHVSDILSDDEKSCYSLWGSIKIFRVSLYNWPDDNPCRIIAYFDRDEKKEFFVILFLCSIEIFNKQAIQPRYIPPGVCFCSAIVVVSFDVATRRHRRRCRRRRPRRWLRFSRPSLATHPTLTLDTNTTISRKIPRDVLRVHARRTVFSAAGHTFPLYERKITPRWPTFDVGALIFLSLSPALLYSSPLFLSLSLSLSLSLFLCLALFHPPYTPRLFHCHCYFLSLFFFLFFFFFSIYPWICSFVTVFMLKLSLELRWVRVILYLTRSPPAAERLYFLITSFLLRMLVFI